MLGDADIAAHAPARRRRSRLARDEATSFVRRLDWILFGAVAALIEIGLWAIAGMPSTSRRQRGVLRHAAGGLRGARRNRDDRVALRRPGPPPAREAAARRDRGPHGARLPGRDGRPRLAALDRPRLLQFQPSEFGKVLFVLFLAAFVADQGRRIGGGGRCSPRSASGRSRSRSCSPSRTSGWRSSTAPPSPRCSSSAARAGCTFPCSRSSPSPPRWPCSGCSRPQASTS